MELLIMTPLIIPQNFDETRFVGYIGAGGEEFYLELNLREKGQLQGAELRCEWRLQQLLGRYKDIILQHLEQSKGVPAFLKELQTLVERCITHSSVPPSNPMLGSQYMSEIESLGWHRLISIDPSFRKLRLKVTDAKGRCHIFSIELTSQYPAEPPICLVDLPVKFELLWDSKSNLKAVLNQLEKCVENFQDFWDMMDELDRNTWILKPDPITCDALYRCIAIDSKASLQIVVDPRHPRDLPECLLLGADIVTSSLKQKFNENIHRWDANLTLLQNLRMVLDIDFPSPVTSKKEDFSIDCGICFTDQLDGEKADKICDNPQCGQAFHNSCLFEWLRVLSTSRRSFDVMFGDCPSCDKPITVKVLN